VTPVLLDTHVLLWWLSAPDRLSSRCRALFDDRERQLLVSSVSTAEIAIKSSIGRLELPLPVGDLIDQALREDGLTPLAFEHRHAAALATLPLYHRDPFDRMLLAQAMTEGIPLASADRALLEYDIELLW
jgi:PIN domain nuclease of toxin-antitoxin system